MFIKKNPVMMQHLKTDEVVFMHSKLGNGSFRGALESTMESALKDQ